MRIHGRGLLPSTLAERRIFRSLGVDGSLRVPRKFNPYLVARRIARLARGEHPDLLFVREVVERSQRPRPMPPTGPVDADTPEPVRGPTEKTDGAELGAA